MNERQSPGVNRDDEQTDGETMSEDNTTTNAQDDEQFSNPFYTASTITPGRRQLEATRQFLDEETDRLDEQLKSIENDDGSIPAGAAEEWSMTKGRLDQTRLFSSLVKQSLLTGEWRGEADE